MFARSIFRNWTPAMVGIASISNYTSTKCSDSDESFDSAVKNNKIENSKKVNVLDLIKSKSCSIAELITFFSQKKCCDNKYMINHAHIPLDSNTSTNISASSKSTPSYEKFSTLVTDTRHTISQIVDDRGELTKHLMHQFENKYTPSSTSSFGDKKRNVAVPYWYKYVL